MSFRSDSEGRTLRAAVPALCALALISSVDVLTQNRPNQGRRGRFAGREVVEGEVLLKFRGDAIVVSGGRVELAADADVHQPLGRSGVRLLRSRGQRTAQLIARLRDDPDLEFVEPNYIVYPYATPNDPLFSSLWGLLTSTSSRRGTPRRATGTRWSAWSTPVWTTTIRTWRPTCGRRPRRSR
jgi:hypothetical protein